MQELSKVFDLHFVGVVRVGSFSLMFGLVTLWSPEFRSDNDDILRLSCNQQRYVLFWYPMERRIQVLQHVLTLLKVLIPGYVTQLYFYYRLEDLPTSRNV